MKCLAMAVVSIQIAASVNAAKLKERLTPRMLFVIMDGEAERRSQENASDIEATDYAMKFCKTLAKTIRELHCCEQERACVHDVVWQKVPLEGADVSSLGVLAIDEEAFVMDENVSHH